MKKSKTNRGFSLLEFQDRNGEECSLQKSSDAEYDCVWLGVNKLKLQHFVAGQGWEELTFPQNTISEHYVSNTRMHLNRKQVKKLLPYLQKFAETGELF